MCHVARLGIGSESLRNWVRQVQGHGGRQSGVTTDDARVAELGPEVRELRRTKETLKAPAYFYVGAAQSTLY